MAMSAIRTHPFCIIYLTHFYTRTQIVEIRIHNASQNKSRSTEKLIIYCNVKLPNILIPSVLILCFCAVIVRVGIGRETDLGHGKGVGRKGPAG